MAEHDPADVEYMARLTAERDRYLDVANKNAQTARQAEAQLAKMRTLTERVCKIAGPLLEAALSNEANPKTDDGPNWVFDQLASAVDAVKELRQALATDGKAAADVLAAVGEWVNSVPSDPGPMTRQEMGLCRAWDAYRKEGRDDGS